MPTRATSARSRLRASEASISRCTYKGRRDMRGSGIWHAEQAWLGHVATDVLIEVEGGRIKAITEDSPEPAGAVKLEGFTFPGLANVHSHVFQESLRGRTEAGGGDFWEWRRQMFDAAQGWDRPSYAAYARTVFREMLHAGITAVGEFHYLHRYGNDLGEALIEAARAEGIRITLLDACYLRGGLDGRPLEGVQRSFSDADVERWAARVGALRYAGSALCVGSDSSSVTDVLEEARALELAQRRATGRRVIHTPEKLLEAATVEGMRSLGWEAGELKPGMLADFATVQPPRMDWRGLGVGYLIFCCSARDVTHVVVGGRSVVGKAS